MGDKFGEVMLRNLRARGCPLAGVGACQNLNTQRQRYCYVIPLHVIPTQTDIHLRGLQSDRVNKEECFV